MKWILCEQVNLSPSSESDSGLVTHFRWQNLTLLTQRVRSLANTNVKTNTFPECMHLLSFQCLTFCIAFPHKASSLRGETTLYEQLYYFHIRRLSIGIERFIMRHAWQHKTTFFLKSFNISSQEYSMMQKSEFFYFLLYK